MARSKRMALSMLAMLLLGSLTVAAAYAHQYNAKSSPITALGENHSFTAGEAVIKCKKAEFKYTGSTGKLTVLDVTPAYKECKVLGSTALITVEKAQFEFGAPIEVKSNEFSTTAAIIGGTGAQIKVTATISGEKCEVVFPAQKPTGETTSFINNLGLTGGEVHAKIEGIEYKSNSKCAGFVGEKGKAGQYEGNAAETGLIVE
jgi:hypothetical protein